MNTEATIFERLEKVTPELLAIFFDIKGVSGLSCQLCRRTDMSIPRTQALTIYSKMEDASPGREGCHERTYVTYLCVDPTQPDSVLSYQYRIICKNCGCTTHIAVHPVLLWIEQADSSNMEV